MTFRSHCPASGDKDGLAIITARSQDDVNINDELGRFEVTNIGNLFDRINNVGTVGWEWIGNSLPHVLIRWCQHFPDPGYHFEYQHCDIFHLLRPRALRSQVSLDN
jgi:hypothetical protein